MGVFSGQENDPKGYISGSAVDKALSSKGHPYAFLLSLSIFLFLGVTLLWASIAKMDDVTRGQGAVIPAEGIVPVQSERGGKILKILAKENQQVEEGELIVSLSSVDEFSSLRDLQNKKIELMLAITRLNAEANGRDLYYTEEIEKAYPDVVRSQREIFNSRRQQFLGEIEQLEAQIEQRKEEVNEMLNKQQESEANLEILSQRLEKVKDRVGTAITKIDFLELQSEIVTAEGEQTSAEQNVARAKQGVSAAEEHLKNSEAEWHSQIAEELNKDRMDLAAIGERITVGSEELSNLDLHAPVAGTIKQVLLKEDGVAKPGQTILEIIPSSGSLVIEAKFSPKDRGFLYVDQEAVVKFTSYDFSIYGGLEANITRISEDTIEDKKGESWFEVQFKTKEPALIYKGQELEIHPGMTVIVDVLTDKHTVLDNILRPIKNAVSSAMTER